MQLPDDIIARALNFRSEKIVSRESISRNGRRIVSGSNAHRYYFKIESRELPAQLLREYCAWKDEHASCSADIFTAKIPLLSQSAGWVATNPGSPVVAADAFGGDRQITIGGLPASVLDIFRPFDMLTFSNHTKLYAVGHQQSGGTLALHPWSTNGAGTVTITLTKELINDVPQGTLVNVHEALITASPVENTWSLDVNAATGKGKFSLDCKEHY